jgi:hypothetical protein
LFSTLSQAVCRSCSPKASAAGCKLDSGLLQGKVQHDHVLPMIRVLPWLCKSCPQLMEPSDGNPGEMS